MGEKSQSELSVCLQVRQIRFICVYFFDLRNFGRFINLVETNRILLGCLSNVDDRMNNSRSRLTIKNQDFNKIQDRLLSSISYLLTFFQVSLVLGTIFLITKYLYRGIDWTDESWSVAMNASGRVSTGEPWGFQYLLNPFFKFTDYHFLLARTGRFAGYFLACVISGYLIFKLIKSKPFITRQSRFNVIALIFLGAFVAFSSDSPNYLAYNELSGWLLAIILILLTDKLLDNSKKNYRLVFIKAAIVTFCLVMMYLGRFTSFLILALLILIFIIASHRLFSRVDLFGSLAGVIGGFMFLIFTSAPLRSYTQSILNLIGNNEAQKSMSHPASELLEGYVIDLVRLLSSLSLYITLILVFLSLFHRYRTHEFRGFFEGCLYLTLFVMFIIPRSGGLWDRQGLLVFQVAIATVTIFVINEILETRRDGLAKRVAVIATLTIFPFVFSFGTGNPIVGQVIFHSITIFVAAGWQMFGCLPNKYSFSILSRQALALLMTLIIAISCFDNVFKQSYRTAPLSQHKSLVQEGPATGLRVTDLDLKRIMWLQDIRDKILKERGQYEVISIATPGDSLFMGYTGWSNVWIRNDMPYTYESLKNSCKIRPVERVYVVANSNDSTADAFLEKIKRNLKGCNIKSDAKISKVYVSSEDIGKTVYLISSFGT